MSDELMHYGVLGMKWGVRRGRAAQSYAKASKKLTKLDNKFQKAQRKADKKFAKAQKKEYGLFSNPDKAKALYEESRNAQYKANKRLKKAKKWVDAMSKTFAKTDIKLSNEQVELGKQYAAYLRTSSQISALR